MKNGWNAALGLCLQVSKFVLLRRAKGNFPRAGNNLEAFEDSMQLVKEEEGWWLLSPLQCNSQNSNFVPPLWKQFL